MTTLCEANRAAGSTKRIFSLSLIIPLFMGLMMWALALGAAPELPFLENYLAIIGVAISGLAMFIFPASYLFKWNWESKYYGSFLFPFATGLVLGVCPMLCITLYGTLPLFLPAGILLLEIIGATWWSWRIVELYKGIFRSKNLFYSIYVEKKDAIYYYLQVDKSVVENTIHLRICPPSIYFIPSVLLAFLILPFALSVSKFVGVPFTHIIMAIIGAPLNLLFIGICTKCWLVFYFYPKKLNQETGKKVYVDMSSQPKNIIFLNK